MDMERLRYWIKAVRAAEIAGCHNQLRLCPLLSLSSPECSLSAYSVQPLCAEGLAGLQSSDTLTCCPCHGMASTYTLPS
jgi:hypothetical protein